MRNPWFSRLVAAALLGVCAASAQAAITISPATLPNWTVNVAYSQTLTASGCVVSCTWSATGTLPAGLSLDGSGVISGTPSSRGTYEFTVTAADLLSSGSQAYTVVINPAPSITTSSLPDGKGGTAYSQTVGVAGGTSPYSFSVSAGALPPGLTLNASSGAISGTPSTVGVFKFTVTVTDSAMAQASQAFSLAITGTSSPLTITTTSPLANGTVGVAYSQTLAASGGTQPYTWSVTAGALPAGISLSASTGTLAGTPSLAGTFTFTAKVTDKNGAEATKQITITIGSASGGSLTITSPATLPDGVVGTAYSQAVTATGGLPPYRWSIAGGALPAGLSLSTTTGAISGSPTSAGLFTFTAQVTDSGSHTAEELMTITIVAGQGTPEITMTGVPAAADSAQQITFDLKLSSGYSKTISGQVVLTFQPDAQASKDDPAIQFSTGGRVVNFTFPPNTTEAQFPASPMALQTGTVAGTIALQVTSDLPGGNLDHSTVVARAVPVIRSVTVVKNSSGFQVQVVGFSNSRELADVSLSFEPAAGKSLQTTSLQVTLSDVASQWYASSSSAPFGGQFLLALPFSVQQGSTSDIGAVSVQLTNSLGTSSNASANF